MTVQTDTNVATIYGNGIADVFPFGFKFNADQDLIVIVVDEETEEEQVLTLFSDYTVQGARNPAGGSITLTAGPLPVGKFIVIRRFVDLLQLTDLRNQGKFFAEVHEDAFDLAIMIDQQQQEELDRSMKKNNSGRWNAEGQPILDLANSNNPNSAANKGYVDAGDQASREYADQVADQVRSSAVRTPEAIPSLPSIAGRANRLLSFDSMGNPVAVAPQPQSATELAMQLASPEPGLGAGFLGRGVIAVDSISDLASYLSNPAAQKSDVRFMVKGYLPGSDEGGGEFYWSSEDLSSQAASDPLQGIYVPPTGQDGSTGAAVRIYEGFVSPSWWGAQYGSSDESAFLEAANAISLEIKIPAGKAIELQNWVPLAGTTIDATGAVINRNSDALASGTSSSAAIVSRNGELTIIGGQWGRGAGATRALSFSGSILIDGGSCKINGGVYRDTWGGIFGNDTQNGSNKAEYVALNNVEFVDCAHNSYLADIEHFAAWENRSHRSDRDGLRLYRNVSNIIVMGGHYYDNGNGSPTQSQDGMDLFFGGKYCLIQGNHIYGNDFLGIDIKRGVDPVEQPVFGEGISIIGNYIHNNGDRGIRFGQSLDPVQYNERMHISGNYIFDNGQYGIEADYCKNLTITGSNYIYGNGRQGIRIENSDGVDVSGNFVYNNGQLELAGSRSGIEFLSTVTNFIVTNNTVYPGGTSQTAGIVLAGGTGRCYDNNVSLHSGSTILVSGSGVKGKTMRATEPLVTGGRIMLGMFDRPACVTGGRLAMSDGRTLDYSVIKRDAAGAVLATIGSAAGVAGATGARVEVPLPNSSANRMTGVESLQVILANVSSPASSLVFEVDYCD